MKTSRLFRAFSIVTISTLSSVMLSVPTQAVDPQGPAVLLFANTNCTNASTTGIQNTITTIASSVTVFDGGNGSGAAWQTALTGIDVLVFPEAERADGNPCTLFSAPHIDSSAQAVIKTWVESGKIILGTGSYTHVSLVNYLSGLNFNAEFNNLEGPASWERITSDTSLPAIVPNESTTLGLAGYNSWSADKKSLITRVYYRESVTSSGNLIPVQSIGVGYFTFGSGYYIYNAWDWFQAQSPDSQQLQNYATWDATLKFGVQGKISPNPRAPSPPPPATNTGSSAPAPQKQHVSTLDQTPAPGETVAMFGSYFEGVTEVFVGGVKVDIVSKSDNRVNIRMPRGLTGALDVELKSPLGSLLLPKHFTIGRLPAAGGQQTTLIVGGFDPNSRKLSARMQARIDRWLERNSDLSTLTCTGFTSLPRRTTDVQLSTNRGTTACNFAKSQRPELTTSVSQGVEDPRPGSNVRRVKLVLMP